MCKVKTVKVKRHIGAIFVGLVALLSLSIGCGGGSGLPGEQNNPDGGGDPNAPKALVLSMWEQSGTFGVIDVSSRTPRAQLGPTSSDAVAHHWKEHLFIINRLNFDNIQVMDARTFALHKQYSVGIKSNPQDIAIVDKSKAYISRLASDTLLVVSPLEGTVQKEIDLSKYAEVGTDACKVDAECTSGRCLDGLCAVDGKPEMAQMHLHGHHLFVALQRLNRNRLFAAQAKGMLAVLDTNTDQVVKTLPTTAPNPTSMQASADGKTLYVAQPGQWLKGPTPVLDGVIEAFDLDAMRSKGILLRESDLGGNIVSFAIFSETRGYVVRSDGSWRTSLLAFDPSTAKPGRTIATSQCVDQSACFFFAQLALNDRGELYLLDRYTKQPGVRIFDANTGEEQTKRPIDMGLPPGFVLFFSPGKP